MTQIFLHYLAAFAGTFTGILAVAGLVFLVAHFDPYHRYGSNRKED